MYRAKERGRNTFEIFSPDLRQEANEQLAMEAALRRALDAGELVLHYQPKVDLKTGRPIEAPNARNSASYNSGMTSSVGPVSK